MAATIGDVPVLAESVVNKDYLELALDIPRVVKWKCTAPNGCGGLWTEAIRKRAKFTRCPECEPNPTRKAKVKHPKENERSRSPSRERVKSKSIEKVPFGDIMTCPICYGDYPASEMTTCEYCNYQACKECTKMYILGLQEPAKCMNVTAPCERQHTEKWLVDTFRKRWFDEVYRAHISKIAIDAARARIPEVIHIVPLYRASDAILDKANKAFNRYDKMKKEKAPDAELKKQRKKVDKLDRESEKAERQLELALIGKETDDRQPELFVQGCTVAGCNGLVSANDYKCKVCGTEICKLCHVQLKKGQHQVGEPTDPGVAPHVCDPNDVETVKELASSTRPCPKCAAPVFKVDGCDQMWCVKCHTTFDWVTNKIVTGPIHNPEFFRWMREQRDREPDTLAVDAEADRCELDRHQAEQLTTRLTVKLEQFLGPYEMMIVTRIFNHIRQVPPERVQTVDQKHNRLLKLFTLRYIVKKITEKEWIKLILSEYYEYEVQKDKIRAENALAVILTEILTYTYRELSKLPHDKYGNIEFRSAQFEARHIVRSMLEQAKEAREFINRDIAERNYMIPKDLSYEILNDKWEWETA